MKTLALFISLVGAMASFADSSKTQIFNDPQSFSFEGRGSDGDYTIWCPDEKYINVIKKSKKAQDIFTGAYLTNDGYIKIKGSAFLTRPNGTQGLFSNKIKVFIPASSGCTISRYEVKNTNG